MMPFIDPDFLPCEAQPAKLLLMTSADDSDVTKISFELAKLLEQKGNSVLWIDGNLGEKSPNFGLENPNLEKVILGQLPLTDAIFQIENISVLAGHSKHCLAELPESKQYQFLTDLQDTYPNYDKVILSVDGKNPTLQQKWIQQTDNTYLLFKTKNLLLNRTLAWLKENQAKGLIGLGKNDQEVLLTYMRLKDILGVIPELILDIKKIAP